MKKNILSKTLLSVVLLILGTLCAEATNTHDKCRERRAEKQVKQQLKHMSIREKVGQVFNIRLESLCEECWPMTNPADTYHYAGKEYTYAELFATYPAGSISLFGHNIVDSVQLKALTSYLHALPMHPLLCIDEEGGRVARIGRNKAFDVPVFEDGMRGVGVTGEIAKAYEAGKAIGGYLHRYGLDINYAPLADVCLMPDSSFLGSRLFGSNPEQVAAFDSACMMGMREEGVVPCYKHFPGHGNTKDTHQGAAVLERTKDDLWAYELVPFRKGIESGLQMIMVAHISVPSVTGDSLPATLSACLMDTVLRQQLHYDGVIITDGLEMKAITTRYSSGEAAIQSFLAGADMLMLPANYREAFDAMVEAVENGRISKKRLDASVRRILLMKSLLVNN